MSEARKSDLETAVHNAGGRALEVDVIANEDRFEIHFLLDARGSNEAFREGEKVMRVVSGGGFWQGTSAAGFWPAEELAP